MWKFVIASDNSSDWQVAFDGQPLFTALGPEGLGLAPPASAARTARQPITAPPVVRSNDRNKLVTVNGKEHTVRVTGLMVAFGTGRNITTDDPVSNHVQSVYAVLDNTVYKQVDRRVSVCSSVSDAGCGITEDMLPKPVTDFSHLVKRAMRTQSLSGAGNSEGRKFWAQDSVASIALDWARHKGWYFDLPGAGERLLAGLEFYDGSNVLAVFSTIPAKGTHEDSTDSVESCIHTAVDNERQYLSLLNIMDGSPPRVQVMDVNGDGIYGAADAGASRMTLPDGPLTKTYKNDRILIKSPKEDEKGDLLATLPEVSLRPNWRQLR